MSFLRRILMNFLRPLRALLRPPKRMPSFGGRLLSLSLPGRVALLSAFLLLICAVTVYVFARFQPGRSADAAFQRGDMLIAAVLIVVIPCVLYYVVKLLLEGNVSHYPDIEDAWDAGIDALADEGLDIADTPLFLILGSSGTDQEQALMEAARVKPIVDNVPSDPRAPLHWHANEDGIYLFLTDTSCLSRIAGLARQATARGAPGGPPTLPAEGEKEPTGTVVTRVPRALASAVAASVSLPMKTVAAMFRSLVVRSEVSAGPVDKRTYISLSSKDWKEMSQQLEHVCGLIHRSRRPICPINGALTLLPYPLLRREIAEKNLVERAVESDLTTVHERLQIRCPVTALVVGMEEEPGFFELVRRMGRDKAAGRLGQRFSIGNPPTGDRLKAVSTHACGLFEDWVYKLFREKQESTQVGNRKLFSLLCGVRHHVQSRLASVLGRGYAVNPSNDAQATNALFFSGCYFAAAGKTEDRQAFIQGVFRKLADEQDELEWTDEAVRRDDRYRTLSSVVWAVDAALVLGLILLWQFG